MPKQKLSSIGYEDLTERLGCILTSGAEEEAKLVIEILIDNLPKILPDLGFDLPDEDDDGE